ncbi:hypothetical protein Zmor_005056 [Zophobas morio]|uniref:Uncharacterized protein n=1 Tax=Zophobas morio TaxID=2755281 RepID=A0AA38ING5_9CUCU|nr:hypothetical protein Zmor_005056 [Zophobas morio]
MRSPEHRNTYTNRTGQNYDNELSSHYKPPGAFTVLPPDDDSPQDPPHAPQPYRLTPSARRHKNMSFAILAEPTSAPGSRSPSPTGRVSPFRGRGFNPTGSRHASPAPSPPPEAFSPFSDSPHHSKIPRLSRRGSATAFGEKITDYQSSPNRRKLNSQLSQSLTNIAPPRVSGRPPPSPRRTTGYSKVAFQRLSPIAGSSPEPSQSQSSPKVSSSSNQQANRFASPGRSRSFVNRPPAKAGLKAGSRNVSREPSPGKNPTSPTRIPVKSYRNVQAKVNSFSRTKPKVPPKPQVLSEETTEESDVGTARRRVGRRDSVVSRTNSRGNLNANTNNKNNNSSKGTKSVTKDTNGNTLSTKNGKPNPKSKGSDDTKTLPTKKTDPKTSSKTKSDSGATTSDNNVKESSASEAKLSEELKKSESSVKLSDLLQPSTTTVVSTTTTTVTQPLKIEAKIDPEAPIDNKTIAPMVDGRVLSATSVSNAMNKMNDTVINSQTLMKETGLTKLSPAASTIISMSKDDKPANPALDTKNATTALPTVEEAPSKTIDNVNSNHVTSTGILPSARVLEEHVQNNMSKLAPETKLTNSIPKSANDRILEARTVVAHDVKPIKITVKEKPMDVEVQSGNIRFDTANGLNERPG